MTTDRYERGLSWRERGDGDVVVLLHGLGGTRRAWADQFEALSVDRRCVAWDMPGYGASELIEPLDFETIADRLIDLLDLLQADRADLVGLSFGGMHAMHAALRHPSRVRRLVLSDTSPQFGRNGTTREAWTAARLAVLDDGTTMRELAPLVLDSIVGSPLPPERRSALIESFADIPEAGFRAAVRCLPTHDVVDRLGEIGHPTLVVVGEIDTETPPSYSRTIADGIPGARLVVLDGIGHLAPSEHPDMFNRLVRDFLDSEVDR